MNLRPCNVLFIDDNKLNLEEAKFFCPDIMTMLPDKIGELYAAVSMLDKNDEKLSRLESYKVLEKKNKIKKSFGQPIFSYIYCSIPIPSVRHENRKCTSVLSFTA